MRISNAVGYALTASAALPMLAGCSGGSSQMAPTPLGPGAGSQTVQRQVVQNGRINNSVLAPNTAIVPSYPVTTPSFMSPDAVGKPLIFVFGISNPPNNFVDIFPQAGKNQKMVGQIAVPNGPVGLATDTARNLYIAENSPDVLVYAPPYTKAPKLTLDDTGYYPSGVAVSPQGVVGVANFCSVSSNCNVGTGSVTFYAENSTKACATIVADPMNFPYVLNDAFDDAGNLYIDGQTPLGSTVLGEITGGCKAKTITLLTTTNTIALPGGIQVDKADRIAIADRRGPVIDTYNRPKNGSLGNPVSTTPLTGTGDPNTFAFLASGVELYAADGFSNVFRAPR